MTRETMLQKMGLSDEDFRNYLTKSHEFFHSLNERQKRFHLDSKHPTLTVKQAAAAFGPDVTEDHVTSLFEEAPPVEGTLFVNSCCGKSQANSTPEAPAPPSAS